MPQVCRILFDELASIWGGTICLLSAKRLVSGSEITSTIIVIGYCFVMIQHPFVVKIICTLYQWLSLPTTNPFKLQVHEAPPALLWMNFHIELQLLLLLSLHVFAMPLTWLRNVLCSFLWCKGWIWSCWHKRWPHCPNLYQCWSLWSRLSASIITLKNFGSTSSSTFS